MDFRSLKLKNKSEYFEKKNKKKARLNPDRCAGYSTNCISYSINGRFIWNIEQKILF